MNILPDNKLEKLLLDPAANPNLLEDAASNDTNLQKAAIVCERLMSRLFAYADADPTDKEMYVERHFTTTEIRDLFKRDVQETETEGTARTIHHNLKNLAKAAEKRIYSGFLGFFLKIFQAIGFYNPEEVKNLEELSGRDFTVLKVTHGRM